MFKENELSPNRLKGYLFIIFDTEITVERKELFPSDINQKTSKSSNYFWTIDLLTLWLNIAVTMQTHSSLVHALCHQCHKKRISWLSWKSSTTATEQGSGYCCSLRDHISICSHTVGPGACYLSERVSVVSQELWWYMYIAW